MVRDISSFALHPNHLLSGGASWNSDLGAIFHTKGKWRIGVAIINAFNGIDGYAAGLATNLSPDATFAVDEIDLKVVQFTYFEKYWLGETRSPASGAGTGLDPRRF